MANDPTPAQTDAMAEELHRDRLVVAAALLAEIDHRDRSARLATPHRKTKWMVRHG